ncbi:acyl-CoA thioesterase [Alicyclobacillus sp.]|uniref:acyl-CoA thioesterase n=1 Tax=Alicyclobacillus sp. TaxID=61169 RepID=UPI0025C12B22|nr:acyl-CoA thioesterase [Alicyclobacillus sp.]MCL6516048.1 acyl-CoA thioesterase [Alicyclobacillus sp.]
MPDVVRTEFEVRWGECDPAGIVYHPAYLDWFSVARMHFLQENGISYMKEFHDRGIVVVVLEAQCQYRKPLRAEDRVWVEAWWRHLSRTRFGFQYRVINAAGEVCTTGRTEHAFIDLHGKPLNLAKRDPDLWRRVQQIPVRGEWNS